MPATLEAPQHPSVEARKTTLTIEEGIVTALESYKAQGVTMTNRVTEIQDTFKSSKTLILEAATGTGKSTVAPLLILEEVRRKNPAGKVLVTQPRRDAAEGVASQLVKRMGGGDYVGYRFKDANTTTPRTQLVFTMERSLINSIAEDPLLGEFDAIVLDEIHERSLDLDTCMILLKDVQKKREQQGKPLKIVLTSATMDPEQLRAYFPGSMHLEVPGRKFNVEKKFAERRINREEIPTSAAEKVTEILEGDEDGDVLMFMPGKFEIEKAAAEVKRRHPTLQVITLMGGGKSNIRRLKERADERTVIIASDVAETSITDDKIRHVIDPGVKRIMIFDPNTKMRKLVTVPSPTSSIDQRIGRAGRVQDGFGHLLITEADYNSREKYLPPQMQRSDLTEQVLLLKSMGIDDVYNLDYLDHPPKEAIDHALQTLKRLGAIDENGKIVPGIGKEMTEMNTNPYFARILVEAERRNCLNEVSILVGILGREKSVFEYDSRKGVPFDQKYNEYFFEGITGNDFLVLINIWNDYVRQVNAAGRDGQAIQTWARAKGIKFSELAEGAKERRDILKNYEGNLQNVEIDTTPENLQNILLSLTTGLVDNTVKNTNGKFTTALGDAPVNIVTNSSVFGKSPKYFMAGKIVHKEHRDKADAEYNMQISEEEASILTPDTQPVHTDVDSAQQRNITPNNTPDSQNIDQSTGENQEVLPAILPDEESMTHNPDIFDLSSEMSQSHYSTTSEEHTHEDTHHHATHAFKYDKERGQLYNTIRYFGWHVGHFFTSILDKGKDFITNILKKLKLYRPKTKDSH